MSNTHKFYAAFALAGLVVGLVLAFPLVRVATPTKVVTHRAKAPAYKLQNGASAQSVYNTLGSPATTTTQTLGGHQYQCAVFVGQQSQSPNWYSLYCFRTS